MQSAEDIRYMRRAIELAQRAIGYTSPNPLVGAVIVHNGEIIGEGWHNRYGEAHAEVNAVNSVKSPELLGESTMYVTLEPCSHWGKTPPCSQLIVKSGFQRVVVGIVDPNPKVSGRGIAQIREAGIKVTTGVLEDECRYINRRFLTVQKSKRPYIVLKWAETTDGYLDVLRSKTTPPAWMTGAKCRNLVHQWRAEEDAIMVGRRTIEYDNPSLTVRYVDGRNPIRVTLDKGLVLNDDYKIFNNDAPTLLFTDVKNVEKRVKNLSANGEVKVIGVDFGNDVLPQILEQLVNQGINSLFVEGGRELLQSFIDNGLWDEARIFISLLKSDELYPTLDMPVQGIAAPSIEGRDTANITTIEGVRLLQLARKPISY